MKIQRLTTIGVLAAILVASGNQLGAATVYVSQTSANPTPPYATWDTAAHTIQEAVDAASDGDTVVVGAGEYALTNQVTVAKAILLQSTAGAGQTTLAGQGITRCLGVFNSAAVVDGFTMDYGNGGLEGGGGVFLVGGTVQNCTIQYCFTHTELTDTELGGGGVHMIGGILSNCIVAKTFNGSQVFSSNGGLITDCRIVDTLGVVHKGGGVYLADSRLRNSTISMNSSAVTYGAATFGGGVYAISSRITGCIIADNWAQLAGGGAYLDACEVDRCIIEGNASANPFGSLGGLGGGVFATTSTIRNSVIAGNRAYGGNFETVQGFGGGVYLQQGSLLNCTVTANRSVQGGGIYIKPGFVSNSIAYFNTAQSNANWHNIGAGLFDHTCTTPDPGGAGNLVDDPQFVDRAIGNYRLASSSPCNDAGFNQEWMNGTYDLDGNPRIRNGTVDMGAYETSDVPVIFSHPQSQAATNGSDVTFSVTASGNPPLTYQWLKNRVAIPGATNSAMTLFDVTETDEGTYSVIASNTAGTAVSSNAVLTVITLSVVTWVGPAHGESFPAGSDILLTARATDADGSVSYVEFYANGIKLDQVVSSTDVYDFVWSNPPAGTFELHAEAVANDGARGISDSVWIVVGDPGNTVISPETFDRFGTAVAISGTWVVVGASDAGRVYVYNRASVPPTIPVAILENPSATTPDFGWSVAISDNWVVVGADRGEVIGGDTGGRAYVYDLGGATPELPVATLESPNATSDHFGADVAVSGTLVVVGAKVESAGAMFAGAAYVYDLASATPTMPVVKLTKPRPGEWDSFGSSVAVSGTRVVVGAPQDDTVAPNAGSAYVYDLASAAPTEPVVALHNPNAGVNDFFGSDVAMSDTRIVVGKPTARGGPGSAYVYDVANVTPSQPLVTINYLVRGGCVAISGTRVVIGNAAGANSGIARVFDVAAPTPTEPIATLKNPDGPDDPDRANVWFGFAVGISGGQVVVGAPNFDGGNGRAYLYDIATQ